MRGDEWASGALSARLSVDLESSDLRGYIS